jgi:AraC-like DNA-binding protein
MTLPLNLKSDDVLRAASRVSSKAVFNGYSSPPCLELGDLTAYQSDGSGCAGLNLRVCDLPACASFFTSERSAKAYHFHYRLLAEKGDMRLTIPALGVVGRRNSRSDILLIPPGVRVEGEWNGSSGKIATFFITGRLLKDIADQTSLPVPCLKRPSLASFSIDPRLDALCRLLMEETEHHCPKGAIYFEKLARALAVSVLLRVHEPQDPAVARGGEVPTGIRCAIQRLENDFIDHISVTELADHAHLSVGHFVRTFKKVTGSTPHRYLLGVRLSHARKLMTQTAHAISIAEIAVTCGFCDQAHFGRNFRRFFGTTPAAFLHAQEFPLGLKKSFQSRKRPKLSDFILYNPENGGEISASSKALGKRASTLSP